MKKLIIMNICALSLFLYAHQAWAIKEASEAAEKSKQATQKTKDHVQTAHDNTQKMQNEIKEAKNKTLTKEDKSTFMEYLHRLEAYTQSILDSLSEGLKKAEESVLHSQKTHEEIKETKEAIESTAQPKKSWWSWLWPFS